MSAIKISNLEWARPGTIWPLGTTFTNLPRFLRFDILSIHLRKPEHNRFLMPTLRQFNWTFNDLRLALCFRISDECKFKFFSYDKLLDCISKTLHLCVHRTSCFVYINFAFELDRHSPLQDFSDSVLDLLLPLRDCSYLCIEILTLSPKPIFLPADKIVNWLKRPLEGNKISEKFTKFKKLYISIDGANNNTIIDIVKRLKKVLKHT